MAHKQILEDEKKQICKLLSSSVRLVSVGLLYYFIPRVYIQSVGQLKWDGSSLKFRIMDPFDFILQADKSTIVDEAVNYIKKLQETLEELQKRKLERATKDTSLFVTHKLTVQSREAFMAEFGSSSSSAGPNPPFLGPEYPALFKTWSSPNVILNICGREAQISVCSVRKPGLLTALSFVMEKNNLEVLSAHASSDRARSMFMIHARVSPLDRPLFLKYYFNKAMF